MKNEDINIYHIPSEGEIKKIEKVSPRKIKIKVKEKIRIHRERKYLYNKFLRFLLLITISLLGIYLGMRLIEKYLNILNIKNMKFSPKNSSEKYPSSYPKNYPPSDINNKNNPYISNI